MSDKVEKVPLDDQISEVERVLAERALRNEYQIVREGVAREEVERRDRRMNGVLATLKWLKAKHGK